jgi:predicted metal-dependent enzyme (double-stranded beta helix superfamily)
MKHIPSPFREGDLVRCDQRGFGTVLKVTFNPRSADKIVILYLGGLVCFLAGSQEARSWHLDNEDQI